MMSKKLKLEIIAPILACIIYGGWAAFVNSEHGTEAWLKAGLGQGLYALFSTWIVTFVTQIAFRKIESEWLAFILGFLAGFAVMVAIPVVIHNILKTPDILEAITPGLIWGSGYVIVVLRLAHKEKVCD